MSACEWCNKESAQLSPIRDWEEGPNGPEHWICPECVEKHRQGFEAASAEWAAHMEGRYVEGA